MKVSQIDYEARISRLAKLLDARDIQQAAFIPGPNFYFLTGLNFHLMERPTVLIISSNGDVSAIIPEVEKSQWQGKMPNARTCFWNDAAGFEDAFKSALCEMNGVIAVEGLRMRIREMNAIQNANPILKISDEQELISSIRLCKDASEIATIEQAIDISEKALQQTLETVAIGMSETDLKRNLMMAMLEFGADATAFDPIVLFGANAADCHGQSNNSNKLKSGDAVLIDFGAAFGGYNADITRTFFAQKCSNESRDIYETVLAANEKGREIARPGLTASHLDEGVTKILLDSKYKDLIAHKTGHGLGIDVHEWPQIMVGNHQPLAEGMVLTIEPGLYQPGKIGVRIEDDVLITDNGCRSLTRFPRELILVG